MLERSIEVFAFKDWLRYERRIMESSIYVYGRVLHNFFVETEDLDDIEQYNWFIAKHAHKNRSTHCYSVLRDYIMFRYENNPKMQEEFTKQLLRPKRFKDIKIERKHLSDDKLLQVVSSMTETKHVTMAIIQILGAIRASDVLGIRRGSISEETYDGSKVMRIVTIGKGEKRVVLHIFDTAAIDYINGYLKFYDSEIEKVFNKFYQDYIFITLGNNPFRPGRQDNLFMMKRMNYNWYQADLKLAIDKSGVVERKFFSTHDFRRCFARKVWEKYKDVDILQKLLNHEDPSTTLRYLRQSGLQNIDVYRELQS